ncbi:fasciclin domain-containing protein [Foetidibacter luteolus]|uniref:fasciclin domain-containing protein n=1 Tax=Foetidibacter luteolus TaxID=2608880 RepID=UPI001A9865D5|nr:fasciclin domain-containing protein [Foetidibacter luteolus]
MAQTILDIAGLDRFLTNVTKGLKATTLGDTLNERGPFTLFAPVNLAFESIGKDSYDSLLKPGNARKLLDILSFHILESKKLLKDFRNGEKLRTINGKTLTVAIKDGQVFINGSKVLSRDRQASNGVIHSLNSVNLPEGE